MCLNVFGEAACQIVLDDGGRRCVSREPGLGAVEFLVIDIRVEEQLLRDGGRGPGLFLLLRGIRDGDERKECYKEREGQGLGNLRLLFYDPLSDHGIRWPAAVRYPPAL